MKTKKVILLAMVLLLVQNISVVNVYAAQIENVEDMTAQNQTEELQETAKELTSEELAAYYGDSVFIGDSIMLGFRNYCMKQKKDSFLSGIQFLAVGGYSANNAMKPVTDKNVHPMYKGKKYQVWDALSLMETKRVFILLGMNDISVLGLEGARDRYEQVIDKILEVCPDMEINIISVTYTLKDKGKGKLNNENIAKYNELLKEMVIENGWGYVDMATPLSDGNGNLMEGACSDEFVHLSRSAYAIWETVLVNYANARQDFLLPKEQGMNEIEAVNEVQGADGAPIQQ